MIYMILEWFISENPVHTSDLFTDQPVGDEHGGHGVGGQIEPVHVHVLHQSVANLCSMQAETSK